MYFLRVDYVYKGNGVCRVRSTHPSFKSALATLRRLKADYGNILLVRIELCG